MEYQISSREKKNKRLDSLKSSFEKFFKEEGFQEIFTPNYEDLSLYGDYSDLFHQKMTKTIDGGNRILVLRPDMTIPAAKIASKRNEDTIRFYYSTTIFREYRGLKTHGKDFLQTGIEFFGDQVDEEKIISLALRSLKNIGKEDLVLNLSNVQFMQEAIEELDLNKVEELTLLNLMDRRNHEDIDIYLLRIGKQPKRVLDILQLYGNIYEVIEEAKDIVDEVNRESLENLEALAKRIHKEFPDIKINIDLGKILDINYYNGIYFEVYSNTYNVSLLSGGAYDDLMENFGSKKKAMGFGINLNILEESLRKKQSPKLKIAIAKGRIQEQAMEMLGEVGLKFKDYSKKSRKLLFESENGDLELIFVKNADVITYIETGTCDLGIVGSDLLREKDHKVYEMENLDIGKCHMSLAVLKGTELDYDDLTVASKYPNITKKYFAEKGVFPNIIKLNGSVELGPIVGISDCIVDIVETGNTLRENGLIELDKFTEISSRVIVNKFSLIHKAEKISCLINYLKGEDNEKNKGK